MTGRLPNGAAAIAGAATAARFPAFRSQYPQRPAGRPDLATLTPARRETAAHAVGPTLGVNMRHVAESVDGNARDQGPVTPRTVEDADRPRVALDTLPMTGPLDRPLALARHFGPEVARRTLAAFEPAMPITLDGPVHAAIGMVAGLGLSSAVEGIPRRLGPSPRRLPEAA